MNVRSSFRVQAGSGVHPASYQTCTGSSFPGIKRLGREADTSPPYNTWSYTSAPPYVFMSDLLVLTWRLNKF